MTGRTNSSKVTRLLTGLPGRPNSSALAAHATKRQRLAGLDGDAPQVDPTDCREGILDDVVGTD